MVLYSLPPPRAERSLVAKLPQDWVQLKTDAEGHPYYYNQVTQESRWDHPSDNEYRELFRKKKEEAMQQNTLSSPRHYHPTSPMSSPSVSEQNLSTFSVNTPPAPPRSPSESSVSERQRARMAGELDSANELNEQLKAEIEEEVRMERGEAEGGGRERGSEGGRCDNVQCVANHFAPPSLLLRRCKEGSSSTRGSRTPRPS